MATQTVAAKCKACETLSYPTHFYCPSCGKQEFEPVPIEGDGKLVTWTRAHALSLDYAERFITLGIVEMDMGVCVTGRLAIEEPRIGMRVRAHQGKVRETSGRAIYGLIFGAK